MSINADALKIGGTYFRVTFPDSQTDLLMIVPVVLTYRYLGKNLPDGVERDGLEFFFRYLPPVEYQADEANAKSEAVTWSQRLPRLFSGWGADVPEACGEDGLVDYYDIGGLIRQLTDIADRTRQR